MGVLVGACGENNCNTDKAPPLAMVTRRHSLPSGNKGAGVRAGVPKGDEHSLMKQGES